VACYRVNFTFIFTFNNGRVSNPRLCAWNKTRRPIGVLISP